MMGIAVAIAGCNGCDQVMVNRFTFHPSKGRATDLSRYDAPFVHRFLTTADGVKISVFHADNPNAKRTLIYFHGNAGNATGRLPDADRLYAMGLNVLLVDYRGYGASGGEPSEEGIYLDAKAALDFAVGTLKAKYEDIILLGRSLGSAVAVDLAEDRALAAVILVSPFSSGRAMAEQGGMDFLLGSDHRPFDSKSKIANIEAPLLIIHGSDDTLIPMAMGQELFDAAAEKKRFVPIEGAGHNDISSSFGNIYFDTIEQFLETLSSVDPRQRSNDEPSVSTGGGACSDNAKSCNTNSPKLDTSKTRAVNLAEQPTVPNSRLPSFAFLSFKIPQGRHL